MVRYLSNDLYQISFSLPEELQLIDEDIKLKQRLLEMIFKAHSGHPGGSFSCTQILISLYEKVLLNVTPDGVDSRRDRFILSKGHAAPALYAILAKKKIIPETELPTFRQFHSKLQGHPKRNPSYGIDVSTGSLGMGASMAVGMALAFKSDRKTNRVYALLGDGECNEGVVWETAMAASHFRLDNLVFIIDRNGLQLDGSTEKIMGLEPLGAKWEAFGWHVIEIDGTSFRELLMAFETAKQMKGRPVVIISYMIKGQGVSFMQHIKDFHGKAPNLKEFEQALIELREYGESMKIRAKLNRKDEFNQRDDL
jgi:transketolase